MVKRVHGRKSDELRPLTVHYNVYGYADASVLLELGNTKVHCSVTIQSHVPPFLKGKKTGWLKAEYAMLPCATHARTQRESSSSERNGRSVEISRLIARCLRTMVNLDGIGEQTIVVDCDVLQADGSTRVACITAACLALKKAQERWLQAKLIASPILTDEIAAVSVGINDNAVLLDLDFAEDSSIHADFNVVMTKSGDLVEIQGTSEKKAVTWEQFEQVRTLAVAGVQKMFQICANEEQPALVTNSSRASSSEKKPIFSLANRLK